MTDFLTNLAARTLAQPTLRPRMRALFEPVADESPLPVYGERVAEGRVRGVSFPLPPDPEVITHEVPITQTVIVPDERTITITKEKRIVIPQHRTNIIREREEVLVPHRTTIHTHTEAAAETRPRQSARTTALPPSRKAGGRASVPPAPRATLTGGETPLVQPAGRQRSAIEAAQSTQQEQTIHVSIGRVEVRAVAPTAAPPRTPTQKPMTIDDYLARREKKERR